MLFSPLTRPAIPTLTYLMIGPVIAAVYFLIVYGSQSSLCAFGVGSTANGNLPVAILVVIASAIGILACALTLTRPMATYAFFVRKHGSGELDRFIVVVMQLLNALSLLAITLGGIAALVLPACGQLR